MSEVELYRPSNCDEGEWFHGRFCYKCAKFPNSIEAKKQCMIFLRSNAYSIGDPEYPREWRYVDESPICTAFKDRDEFNAERRAKRKPKYIAISGNDLFDSASSTDTSQ